MREEEEIIKIIEEVQENEFKDILVKRVNRKQIEDYVKNNIIQKFYLQESLIGEHKYFKDEKDYTLIQKFIQKTNVFKI